MPTKHQRIWVTSDPELTAALARVARFYEGVPRARMLHDLAIKGAETIEQENARRSLRNRPSASP